MYQIKILHREVYGYSRDSLFHVDNMFQLPQEPFVDSSEFPDALNGETGVHSIGDGEQSLVGRIGELEDHLLFIGLSIVVL
jgi:hypothetical protein